MNHPASNPRCRAFVWKVGWYGECQLGVSDSAPVRRGRIGGSNGNPSSECVPPGATLWTLSMCLPWRPGLVLSDGLDALPGMRGDSAVEWTDERSEFAPASGSGPEVTLPEESPGMARRAVLIDARSERRALMRRVVDAALGSGTVVAEASRTRDALAAIDRHRADVVVLDLEPLAEGIAGIVELRASHPSLIIVVCTFRADLPTRLQALSAGADDYLVKPVSVRDLRAVGSARAKVPADLSSLR